MLMNLHTGNFNSNSLRLKVGHIIIKAKNEVYWGNESVAQHIVVTDYNPLWTKMFEDEARLIRGVLEDNCITIYHIGSTSVPGLAAKPIIDIMPVVHSLDHVDTVKGNFEKIGYEYLGEFGIRGRRYLRKGGDERTHQIHIFSEHSTDDIERHLALRDYLRTHKEDCDAYAILKKTLAEKYEYDIDGYCDGKDKFVKQLEQKALDWKNNKFQFAGRLSTINVRPLSHFDIE